MFRRITNAVLPPPPPFAGSTSRPLADAHRDLARWIGQISQDASGFALPRLVQETEYSRLFWEMWLRGLHLRTEVGFSLNRKYGRAVCPDPLYPLAFSFEATIAEAARLLGMNVLVATEENGLQAIAHSLDARSGRCGPIYAWLETYPDRRPPDLIVIPDCPARTWGGMPLPYWVAHAGYVLGWYDKDRELYTGPVAPGDRILPADPVRHPSITPILHMFTKGLLGLGRDCAPGSGCQCAVVLTILNTPPPSHPQATGVWGAAHQDRRTAGRPAPATRPLHEHNGHN